MSDIGENIENEYGLKIYPVWDEETEYKQYDRVRLNNGIYSAKQANIGMIPYEPSNEQYWEVIGDCPVYIGIAGSTEAYYDAPYFPAYVTIDSDLSLSGINFNPLNYASSEDAGIIKIGDNVKIDEDGHLGLDNASVFIGTAKESGNYNLINDHVLMDSYHCGMFHTFYFTFDPEHSITVGKGSTFEFEVTINDWDNQQYRPITGLLDNGNSAREVIWTNGDIFLPCEVLYDFQNHKIKYKITNTSNDDWIAFNQKTYLKHSWIGGCANVS